MDSEYTDLMQGWEDTWLKLITVDKTREAKPNTINTRRGADKIKQEATKHLNIHTGGNQQLNTGNTGKAKNKKSGDCSINPGW